MVRQPLPTGVIIVHAPTRTHTHTQVANNVFKRFRGQPSSNNQLAQELDTCQQAFLGPLEVAQRKLGAMFVQAQVRAHVWLWLWAPAFAGNGGGLHSVGAAP
jgi:hypothetical protein